MLLALLVTVFAFWPLPPAPKLSVRAANAAGDSVWVKVTYALPGSFPATDSVQVDYYRPATTLALSRRTRAAVDSVQLPSLVAGGQTQTFRACTKTVRGSLASGVKCSATVSWTRPVPTVTLPDTTTTPTVEIRAANAIADSVWFVVRYGLPPVFPVTDTAIVDYYRPSTVWLFGRETKASADSVKLAALVAEGQTQTFKACSYTQRGGGTIKAPRKCSAVVSWTRPVPPPDTTGTPTVKVVALFPGSCAGASPCPWNVGLDVVTMIPACQTKVTAGTPWADAVHAIPVAECRDSLNRPRVAQFCTFTKWSDGYWTHDRSTAAVARCAYVKDSLGSKLQPFLATRVSAVANPFGTLGLATR